MNNCMKMQMNFPDIKGIVKLKVKKFYTEDFSKVMHTKDFSGLIHRISIQPMTIERSCMKASFSSLFLTRVLVNANK